jgi:hypothetical protein
VSLVFIDSSGLFSSVRAFADHHQSRFLSTHCRRNFIAARRFFSRSLDRNTTGQKLFSRRNLPLSPMSSIRFAPLLFRLPPYPNRITLRRLSLILSYLLVKSLRKGPNQSQAHLPQSLSLI